MQFNDQIDILNLMYKNRICLKPPFRTSVFFAGILFCLSYSPTSYANTKQLSGIKKEISQQQFQLNDKAKKLNALHSSLKKQEQSIDAIAKKIRAAKFTLKSLDAEIRTLNVESERLTQVRQDQMKLLKSLLNSHYRNGNHTRLTTIFSGKDRNDMDRMTIYTERLSKTRTEAINKLASTNDKLDRKRLTLENQTKKQTNLLAQLQSNKNSLETKQQRKQRTARAIQHQVKDDKSYLVELKSNENRLKEELDIAAEKQQIKILQANVKMDGLGKYKGNLQWPVKGKVLHRYGTLQSGQLNWNGMVISAKEGSEVKATHGGTIILSNWLRGYGLMLVIDHGKGDMSFYGYNQALLRNVGDTVKVGDPIALVGNSGGQSSSGLYFEIRRKGNATNPSPWLIRKG